MIADKGFAGKEFEALMAELGAIFLRPDRKGEKPRFGKLGGMCQWIESIIDTTKGQLSLERHGAHTMPGLITRICQRLLALAASIWHNWQLWEAGIIDTPAAASSPTTTKPTTRNQSSSLASPARVTPHTRQSSPTRRRTVLSAPQEAPTRLSRIRARTNKLMDN